MACTTLTSGLANDCLNSVGGIKKVYIGNFGTLVKSENGVALASSGTKLKAFYVRRGSSSLTSTLTVDDANGVEFWQNDLALVFARQSKTKRDAIQELVKAELCVIVEDSNGTKYALGVENPVLRSAGAAQTGTANSDANNYTLTLSEVAAELPIIIDGSIDSMVEEVA